ncbi:MAG: LysE family translocator [Clostridium sp.]|nr:LysE family translocator [Prevotella sp.]MCM1429580.1 LysE family translocator [Clostridium sp.]MCM1476013.1 LysE family translocator [Muribaculaceae bacterium]
MSLLESFIYMLWRGIAIGMIISAPMGPVGILCIQRTLDKGRKAGLYTGVGAAISDLIYCLLTGFGLSFIEEFLERNSIIIQLFGSVVLIFFAIYLFKKNPAGQLKKPSDAEISTHKNILAGFLFTFSNPLILFLIIGLFARFNFLMPEIKFYHYIIGYVGIIAGALGWWWLVTFFVDKVRSHFNLRSMWLINKIIGGVILIFAFVGIVTALTDLFGGSKSEAAPFTPTPSEVCNPDSTYAIDPTEPLNLIIDASNKSFSLRFVADFSDSPWSVSFLPSDISIYFSAKEIEDPISSGKFLVCSISNGDSLLSETKIPFNGNLSHSDNLFIITRRGNRIELSTGCHHPQRISAVENIVFTADTIRFTQRAKGCLTLRDVQVRKDPAEENLAQQSPWRDEELLSDYLRRSQDWHEGLWRCLDYSTDTNLAKLGGDYHLACVRSLDGYDLIYVDGATICPGKWQAGKVKAHLSATGIDNVFNVTWIDAEGVSMKNNIKAQYENIGLLTLHFPMQNATLRFRQLSDNQ